MLVAETILFCTLATPGVCRRIDERNLLRPPKVVVSHSGATKTVRAEVGDMAQLIKADFSGIAAVSSVEILRGEGGTLRVQVCLSDFARENRRKIYAKERSFYREFPGYRFDFTVIDASQDGLEGRPPSQGTQQ